MRLAATGGEVPMHVLLGVMIGFSATFAVTHLTRKHEPGIFGGSAVVHDFYRIDAL